MIHWPWMGIAIACGTAPTSPSSWTVCVAEECQVPHPPHSEPESGCEHPDHDVESGETQAHFGCTPVSCRYIPVRLAAAPAAAKGASGGDQDERAGAVSNAFPLPAELEHQLSLILHQPAPRLRAMKLSTVMRF